MTKYDYDMAIIGGGAAGLTVASGSAQLGAKTLLIEKEPALGGDCLHYGCVPSKTLIKSAHVYHLLKRSQEFGLPVIEPKPVNFADLAKHISDVIAVIQKHDSLERFCGMGVQVEFGAPEFIDEHSVKIGSRIFSAKNWVIASGSSPAVPDYEGLNQTPFLTNKEIFSLKKLPASMIVLGAGPIAAEMSQAFCRLGTKIDVIQRSDQILSKEDKDVADLAMQVLTAEGVTFHLDSSIRQIKEANGQKHVTFTDNEGKEKTLVAEEILVALGRRPNTENLGLEKIGIDFSTKGIKVDRQLRTSHKHIYAPGDINGAYQFTHAAGYEGGIVISNAVFHLPRKADYTYMPWCTYTHPEIASIGMNEKSARKAGIEYSVWTEEFHSNDRALAEGEVAGKIKMLLNNKEKPIGIQVVGPHAGDLLGEWIVALNGKVKLSTIAGAVHPYPTFTEINKKVVGSLYSGKIFSDTVKKGLKLFFGLKGDKQAPCSKISK